MILYEEAISGRTSMSGETAMLCAYGIYLANGGRKEDFLDLNAYDTQAIISTEIGLRKRDATMIANAVGKMLFKGEKE